MQKKTIKERAYEGEKIYIRRRGADNSWMEERKKTIKEENKRTGKATDIEEFIEELKAEGLWLI